MTYKSQHWYYRALEPIHVGAGGYNLGRVDLTIVREPATRLPKIPGTSLSGAARAYAAMLYEKPEAAGHGKPAPGDQLCPIYHTFGSATESGGGFAGTVSIGDAHIVLFPVSSIRGTVWVTSRKALELANYSVAEVPQGKSICLQPPPSTGVNLGWLWFASDTIGPWEPPHLEFPGVPSERIILVSEAILTAIVNSNLEIRTSVVIGANGTAEEKKLFTYEALPRDTYFASWVVEDDYRHGRQGEDAFIDTPIKARKSGRELNTWNGPLDVLRAGAGQMKWLGVGGMGTRGFGRLELMGD